MLSPLLVFGVMLWLTESLVDWQVEMADRVLRWNRWPNNTSVFSYADTAVMRRLWHSARFK